ncbi:MAG: Ig-like domain-containing protein [Rikenellaceae bacterium]
MTNQENKDKLVRYPIVSLIIALAFMSTLFSRCANVGSPSGGLKDTLAPIVMAMNPENYLTNTDTLLKKIYIEFDEFVQIVEQQKNFFTSPQMKYSPQLTLRGRGVVITLCDTLQPNTTYALNFGSTIRDNNESNPLNSLRYVFSTGDEIDSMFMSGYTENSYKADSASKTFLYFYPADSIDLSVGYDSTLFNVKPSAIARSENNGIFIAQNLKPIDYRVYAMIDENNNSIYEPETDKVGFLNEVVNPLNLTDFSIWFDTVRKYVVAEPQIHLRIFTDLAFRRHLLNNHTRPLQRQAILYFGANYPMIDSIVLDSIPSDKIIYEPLTDGNDTLALWFDMPAELLPDTIRGNIYYYKHDSVRELVPSKDKLTLTWKYFESRQERQEREKQEKEREKAEEAGEEWVEPEKPNPFRVEYSNAIDHNPERPISFEFEYPLRSIDSAAITFRRMTKDEAKAAAEMEAKALLDTTINKESIYRGDNQPFRLRQDTFNIRKWYLDHEWSRDETDIYTFVIPKEAIVNIADQMNDSIVLAYGSYKMENFSTIIVNLTSSPEDNSSYILELFNSSSKGIIERKEGINSGKLVFNYIPVGEYSIRLLQDRNNNGVWDTGNLVERRQPELSKTFTKDGEAKISTKANWEMEFDIDATALFAAESPEELAKRLDQQERDRIAAEEYRRLLNATL